MNAYVYEKGFVSAYHLSCCLKIKFVHIKSSRGAALAPFRARDVARLWCRTLCALQDLARWGDI